MNTIKMPITVTIAAVRAEEGGFCAHCLEIDGVNGQGETALDAMENARVGMEELLAYRREKGLEK